MYRAAKQQKQNNKVKVQFLTLLLASGVKDKTKQKIIK
jgi:hypothetical protein